MPLLTMHLLICAHCESLHFLVRWDAINSVWVVCCEGCGAIYQLTGGGTAELRMKGIEQ
jgi:hypothetical protein